MSHGRADAVGACVATLAMCGQSVGNVGGEEERKHGHVIALHAEGVVDACAFGSDELCAYQ